jgi:hypothetical protein
MLVESPIAPVVEALAARPIGFHNRWCRLQMCYSRSDKCAVGAVDSTSWECHGKRAGVVLAIKDAVYGYPRGISPRRRGDSARRVRGPDKARLKCGPSAHLLSAAKSRKSPLR